MLPEQLFAGDTLKFTTSVPDYPATDGWALSYRLVPRVAGTPITITATASGSDYQVSVAASTTANYTAASYTWTAYVTQGAERYRVDSGDIEILPNYGSVSTLDGRSQAAKAVDDLKAALATYTATRGHIAEYEINGRRMRFRGTAEIVELLSFWQIELAREEAALSAAKGLASPRRYYLRVGHA